MKKFGLEFASSVRTPMSPNDKLTMDLLGKSVDSSLYRSTIGSLLYLTTSRPDISYNVGACARYQANPKESHMTALKRIIKYVKTTAEFSVWYSKDTSDVLAGYSDADWAGNVDDIIFGSTKDELAHSFSKLMQAEFEMSMIGELTHFLGLQIRQQESGTFLS